MLNLNSLTAIISTAISLADKSLSVEPVVGSPLDELSKLCKVGSELIPKVGVAGVGNNSDESFDLVAQSKTRDVLGNYPHDDTMERYVRMAVQTVEQNLNFARNVVNPIIKKVVERATSLADAKSLNGLSPFDVVPYYYPAPYNSVVLAEMVSKYANIPNDDMKLSIIFPPMAANMIRENMKSGVARLDAEIEQWLSQTDDVFLENTYNDVFGDVCSTLSDALSNVSTRPAKALIVYLLSIRLTTDIPDGVNAPLSAYREYMAHLTSQAGVQIAAVIRRRADADRVNRLVIGTPIRPSDMSPGLNVPMGRIDVNGDVYQRWLKDGGTPEVLFGAIHNGVDNYAYQQLLADKDKHIRAWKGVSALLKTQMEFDRFNHFIEGMGKALREEMEALDADLKVMTDATYKQRIYETLQHVKGGGVDEPWVIGRKLVCRVFFPHTDAEKVLWAIATQCKLHPTMDVREAALLATIEIVAEWVASQFTVDSVYISQSNPVASNAA